MWRDLFSHDMQKVVNARGPHELELLADVLHGGIKVWLRAQILLKAAKLLVELDHSAGVAHYGLELSTVSNDASVPG